MKQINGNLIELAEKGDFDLIIHGCNCFCNMGAGIAKNIKGHFNAAYLADLQTKKGEKRKLGTISYGRCFLHDRNLPLIVVNAYTQFRYGDGKRNADYDAIRSCFRTIKETFGNRKLRIGYPLIGCGLAGGDWGIVSKIIDEELDGEDHTLVVYIR